MGKTVVIGITGRARNGKTTVAEALRAVANRYALDARIYDIGAQVLRFCQETRLISPLAKRAELRRDELEILVRVGKEQRDLDQDFWLRTLQENIAKDGPHVAIIPNVRYQNEARWVQNVSTGYLVRVSALNHPDGSPYVSPDRDPNHPSETELLPWPVNFFITAYRGQASVLERVAAALMVHIIDEEHSLASAPFADWADARAEL